jgi:nitroreductase
MDLRTGLRTTGSVRSFTTEPVTEAQVSAVLDTARFAPSGGNKQGWKVIWVRESANRERLLELSRLGWNAYAGISAAGHRPFATDDTGLWTGHPDGLDVDALRNKSVPFPLLDQLPEAAAVLVVCVDLRVIANVDVDSQRTKLAAGASIYPFVWNLLLAARSEGLGGVMTTFVIREQETARELLGIPDAYGIAAMVFLGHPVHQNTKLTRRQVHEFATVDRFDGHPIA